MKIEIAYLYYDLMNLYGEKGNIKEITHQLDNQNIEYSINYLSINDKLDFRIYDLVIINSGSEYNQQLVLNHLLKYKKSIKKAILNNKFFLVTGNALDLFSKNIRIRKNIKALNIFDFKVVQSKRNVHDCLFKYDNQYILGFINNCSNMYYNKYPLFYDVLNNKNEGIHYNNFYGTYLIGPLLVRNPLFCEKFIKDLILSVNPNFKFKDFSYDLEIKAYNTFLNLHYKKVVN